MKKSELINIIKEEIRNILSEEEDEDRFGDGQDLMAQIYGYDQRTHQPDPGDGSFTDAERAAALGQPQNPSDEMTGPTRTLDSMMTSSEKTDELVAAKEQELKVELTAIKRLESMPNPTADQKKALITRKAKRDEIVATIQNLKAYRFGRDI